MADTKILLPERDIPRAWYNVLADVPIAAAAAAASRAPASRSAPTTSRRSSRWP